MATNSIVSLLLEGGSIGGYTSAAMPQYTLENGATLIARECVQELHDIFEVAVVETNEAALAAHIEGASDVMESATYGPVFEAAEKKTGQMIMDFLKKLKDRVSAFFANIGAKMSAFLNDYKKFYESKKEALSKATPLKDYPCIDWDENRINQLGGYLVSSASDIKSECPKFIELIKSITDGNPDKVQELTKKCDAWLNSRVREMGIATDLSTLDTVKLNEMASGVFRKTGEKKQEVNSGYVDKILQQTNGAAKDVSKAQKAFNAAYDDVIKNIKKCVDDLEKKQRAGYAQYIHKVTSTLAKAQSFTNVYASAGYRALIGRANEAKVITNAIIAGKIPGSKSKDKK